MTRLVPAALAPVSLYLSAFALPAPAVTLDLSFTQSVLATTSAANPGDYLNVTASVSANPVLQSVEGGSLVIDFIGDPSFETGGATGTVATAPGEVGWALSFGADLQAGSDGVSRTQTNIGLPASLRIERNATPGAVALSIAVDTVMALSLANFGPGATATPNLSFSLVLATDGETTGTPGITFAGDEEILFSQSYQTTASGPNVDSFSFTGLVFDVTLDANEYVELRGLTQMTADLQEDPTPVPLPASLPLLALALPLLAWRGRRR